MATIKWSDLTTNTMISIQEFRRIEQESINETYRLLSKKETVEIVEVLLLLEIGQKTCHIFPSQIPIFEQKGFKVEVLKKKRVKTFRTEYESLYVTNTLKKFGKNKFYANDLFFSTEAMIIL